MRAFLLTLVVVSTAPRLFAGPLTCDLAEYKASPGLEARVWENFLIIAWTGQGGTSLRARFGLQNGQPIIRDLALQRKGKAWAVLAQDLTPEYRITSGVRRMSEQQAEPLRALGIDITEEVIDKNKWYAFWDAPLDVPGIRPGERTPRDIGLPRKPEEIRRATASFNATSCAVKTNGGRVEVTFPGLSAGIFAGNLRFTIYRGTNLIRMEAIAKTDEQSVAYKYEAGLKGLSTNLISRVTWHDTGGHLQQYKLGGVKNETIVPLKAQNRILVAEGKAGSLATFTPPHTFFFTREVDTNLGYVWYRKDSETHYSIGIRQADREEVQEYVPNFALYNAPPGTWQRMAVYFYASPDPSELTRRSVLAFTHNDAFKPIPHYKTFVNHFHLARVSYL